TYVNVDVKKVTETKTIGHETKRVETDDLYKGETKTKTEGRAGERTLTYEVRPEDGKAVKRTKTSDKVTRKPVSEVVLVGTKSRPAPPPPSNNNDSGNNSGGNSSGGNTGKAAPSAPSGSV